MVVYGAAEPELKPNFLTNLVRNCGDERLPIMVGGYFNIIIRQDEKMTTTSMEGGYSCLI